MILSRKWLNEFVDVSDISDREFDEAMTLSGSKVETVTALDESLKNVVVGKILSMEKHPDSDHNLRDLHRPENYVVNDHQLENHRSSPDNRNIKATDFFCPIEPWIGLGGVYHDRNQNAQSNTDYHCH